MSTSEAITQCLWRQVKLFPESSTITGSQQVEALGETVTQNLVGLEPCLPFLVKENAPGEEGRFEYALRSHAARLWLLSPHSQELRTQLFPHDSSRTLAEALQHQQVPEELSQALQEAEGLPGRWRTFGLAARELTVRDIEKNTANDPSHLVLGGFIGAMSGLILVLHHLPNSTQHLFVKTLGGVGGGVLLGLVLGYILFHESYEKYHQVHKQAVSVARPSGFTENNWPPTNEGLIHALVAMEISAELASRVAK